MYHLERRNDNYNYEISSKTTTTTTSATSYEYTIRNSSDNSIQTSTNSRNSHQQVRVFNAFEETSTSTSTKRYQTKMLLASLIEHFCQAYGDTPDSNRKVFFLICRTLRSLGIVDAEFVDEMTSVRSAFQHAFQKLFYTAVQTVRNQDLIHFDDNLPRMLIKSAPASPQESDEDSSCLDSSDETSSSCPAADKAFPSVSSSERQMEDYFSARTSQVTASSFSNKLSSSATTANPALHCMVNGGGGDFFHNLSVQNSRYKNDFVEKNLLGKGGFASAFCACNRLDGIDYAIKKIRLGNDIEEIDRSNKENPYEKIFREIKNLARLEHHNVIRYYSSWLEFDDSTGDQDGSDESDLEDSYSRRSYQHRKKFTIASDEEDNDTSSIFQGRDPTFSDPSMSSLGGGRYMCNDESGMSQIQFGECSNSGYEAGSAGGAATSNGSWSTSVRSRSASYSNKKAKSGWTLFIQMQLCPSRHFY
jgi:translation initiation factor 2-alpha kinase 1